MGKIKECTQALIEAVQDSSEYKEYHEMLDSITSQPELYSRVNEYRRKNFMIQIDGGDNVQGRIADLQMEFAEILANAQVQKFINADIKLGKRMRKISDKVLEGAGMDISFLDE